MNHFGQRRCCPARDLALCMDLIFGGAADLKASSGCRTLCLHFSWNIYASDSRTRVSLNQKTKESPDSLTPGTFKLSINSLRSKQSSCNVHHPRFLLQKFPEGTWNWSKNLIVANIAFTEENYFPKTKCRVYSNKIKTNHHILISNWITFQLLFLTCSRWKKKSGWIRSSFLSYYWNLDILSSASKWLSLNPCGGF